MNKIPFAEVWGIYPRKAGDKRATRKTWDKLPASSQALAYAHIEERKLKDAGWVEAIKTGHKGFVMHLRTFLNGERWEDEYDQIEGKDAGRNSTRIRDTTGDSYQPVFDKVNYGGLHD